MLFLFNKQGFNQVLSVCVLIAHVFNTLSVLKINRWTELSFDSIDFRYHNEQIFRLQIVSIRLKIWIRNRVTPVMRTKIRRFRLVQINIIIIITSMW